MNTKYVLEFGKRGAGHVDNRIIPTAKLGRELASDIVRMLIGDSFAHGARSVHWNILPEQTRATWQSKTHYVALSRLPNSLGSASAGLWRKDTGTGLFEENVSIS